MEAPAATKVVLVTGANAGLGYQLSLALVREGAHVVMACRSPERADDARTRLTCEVPGATVTTLPLDLADVSSVRALAPLLRARVGQLDVLIHNAGIFGVPLSKNNTGHELHFATNYLGPFALTGVLLPLLRDTRGARIISVGSLAHRFGRLRLEDPYERESDYSPWSAYGRSKVALLSFTMELNRRLRARGSEIIALGAHPGMAPTDIAKNHSVANPATPVGKWFTRRMEAWIPSVTDAIRPILHAACAEDVQGGQYYGPRGLFEIAGVPGKARLNRQALDPDLAARLWSVSERLTGVSYLS